MNDNEFDIIERDTIIEDWLNGSEIDPTDYTAYQIEELRDTLGYNDSVSLFDDISARDVTTDDDEEE